MKKILFVLFFVSSFCLSQDTSYDKVSLKDFKMQSVDTTIVHDAILIVNDLRINFVSGYQYISVYQRIRIETAYGLDYANQQINLFKSNDIEEELVAIKAATYNLQGEDILISDFKEDLLFTENLGNDYVSRFFRLPDVEVGSIIEISYVIKSPFTSIEDIALQYDIPVITSNVSLQFPSYQEYYLETNPLALFKINFEEKDFKKGAEFLKINKEESKYLDQDIQLQRILVNNKTIILSRKNIPALLQEPFSGALNKYQAKLIVSLADGYDQYSQTRVESHNSSWNEVTAYLSSIDDFGNELRSSRFFRKELETALNGVVDAENKLLKTLSFLKSKVKWNGEYGLFTNPGVKKAYNSGIGNSATINLLLTNMLNEAGIEAYPVIVSATDSDTPIFPTVDGFDYVIVQATFNNTTILLDATEEYFNLNRIPQRAVNRKGLLIGKRGKFKWVDLTAKEVQKETTLLMMKLEGNFIARGSGNKKLENYSLLDPQIVKANFSNNSIKEYLQNDVFGLEVSEVEVEGLQDLSQRITFKYNQEYINAFDTMENKLSITPLLNEAFLIDIVELETRTTPLELVQPIENTVVVNIEVPDGYTIVSMPESIKVVYEEGLGSYSYQTDFNNGIISTVATYKMNTSVIMPQNYKTFRQFYKAILDKDAEKVILEKK